MTTPSKFTAERRAKALDCKAVGLSDETTAHFLGINKSTFSRWLDRGREEEMGPYHEFYGQYLEASAQMGARALGVIAANIEEPAIAKWYLERREPGFAPPDRQAPSFGPGQVVIALAFPDGRPMTEVVEVVDAEESPAQPLSLPAPSA